MSSIKVTPDIDADRWTDLASTALGDIDRVGLQRDPEDGRVYLMAAIRIQDAGRRARAQVVLTEIPWTLAARVARLLAEVEPTVGTGSDDSDDQEAEPVVTDNGDGALRITGAASPADALAAAAAATAPADDQGSDR